MTDGLTARQTQILKAIIDEYIDTADAVGSEALEKKYNLGVSPATIRNEMVSLINLGYLKQPHTSAGRVPTPKAIKFYVDQLMEEKQMSLTEEVKAKEEVWDVRRNLDQLLEEATRSLAERTKNMAVAVTDEGKIWYAGYANIFSNPEFSDINTCASFFSFLDEEERLKAIFFEKFSLSDPFDVIFGEELGWPELRPVGITATHFTAQGRNGVLGVIGPVRLRYPTIVPVVRYFGHLIEELSR